MNKEKRLLSGSLHHRGAAAITAILFFVIISTVFVLGLSSPVVRDYTATRDLGSSKGAYYLSEAGLEDAVYRIKNGITIGTTETLSLGGSTATTDITTVSASQKTAASVGAVNTNTRRVGASLSTGAGEDFSYALQVGSLGLFMGKDAVINGNVYSEGPICAGGIEIWGTDSRCKYMPNEGWWTYTTSSITGSVVSTGTTGSDGWIVRVINGGGNSMYAGTITNSVISGSAYCNTNYMTTPSSCSPLPSLAIEPFPLSDADITAFEAAAAAGGSEPCTSWGTAEINTSTTIGPWKYGCAYLNIVGPQNSDPAITVTLQGPIWVTGQIRITGKVNIQVDPAYTGQSIPIIADYTSNPNSSNDFSRILLSDGYQKTFIGAGTNSWVTLISKKVSPALAEYDNCAIYAGNNVSGDVILYAKDGMIQLEGTASVAQVSGKGLNVKDNSEVTYTVGLINTLFYSGPGGSWDTVDWKLGQ